jgi:uncharacterized protein
VYLLFELILFLPLIVYGCMQARKLIPGSRLKHIFVFLYALIFLGYPLAEVISHREIAGWARCLIIGGYYCLPYLLYTTFSVVIIDLAIMLMRRVRVLSSAGISRPRLRSIQLAGYLVVPALIVIWGAWNNNRLQIKNLSVELPQKSSTIGNLNVVFASDFHLSQITNDHLVDDFATKVNVLRPDLVLIGGDVLEGDRDEDLKKFERQFRKIESTYGVYAASGNHERHRGGADGFFVRSGIKLVEDGIEKIGGAFYLGIRKNARFSQRKPIAELLKDAHENLPVILLDHSPTDLENVSQSRVDLQLSGHTHNGQLFPVNLVVMPFEYELAWGNKTKRNTRFIVSSGVQAWGPPVKTAGDSEILSIKVTFRSSTNVPKMQPITQWATNLCMKTVVPSEEF